MTTNNNINIETIMKDLDEVSLKTPNSTWSEYDCNISEKQCRFCFGDEESDRKSGIPSLWMSPCKCDGSIKWVHERCFKQWLNLAPFPQQSACSTCGFIYRKSWRMKSLSEWSCPPLRITFWDVVEIGLDFYSTFKLFRGMYQMLEGKKSIFGQICYFIFWKTFIFTDRRILYYKSIGAAMATSFFEPQVRNVDDEKEKQQK
jgi:hypothetical protein